MKEYKINILKKILITTLSIVLVFSFSFNQWNTSKSYQVKANEYVPTVKDIATLIVGVLAAAGIKVTNDLNDINVTALVNNLNSNAKSVIDSFDYVNKMYGGYVAYQYDQLQILTHGLITELNAWQFNSGTPTYYSENFGAGTVNIDSYLSHMNDTGWTEFKAGTYNANYIINGNLVQLGKLYWNSPTDYEVYGNYYTGMTYLFALPYIDSDGLFKTRIITDATNKSNYSQFTNRKYMWQSGIYDWFTVSGLPTTNAIGFELDAGGLTLPAPLGGWDNSQAGDIDVSDFGKEIDLGTGLPLVVLGGLTIEGLQDLKNKGPQDVYLGDDAITPFDKPIDTTPGSGVGTIDGTVDFPNTDSVPETNAGLAGWLGGALGALTGGLLGALNGILGWIKGIWEWLKQMAGSLSSILSLLLTLPMILYNAITGALSDLFTWDLDATKLKIDELRQLMFLRIPCVNETLEAWHKIISVNGHNLTSSFTIFGHTYSWSSGSLLQAFSQFASLIQQAFRYVFWFIFLKGMRRRITAFLSAMSVER